MSSTVWEESHSANEFHEYLLTKEKNVELKTLNFILGSGGEISLVIIDSTASVPFYSHLT